jgi:ketosteroid isomerase-like protein
MELSTRRDPTEEIRQLMHEISNAWLNGETERLNQYFHERMTINGPDLQQLCTGRQACVKSYEDFTSQTVVLEYEESQPQIDLYGDTAVVVAPWRITYEIEAQEHCEVGRDLLVLVRQAGSWLVVWRALLPQPRS